MILDTCFLIDLMRKEERAIRKHELICEEELHVSTLTLFELFYGQMLYDNPLEEKQRILAVLGEKRTVDFTAQAAQYAGLLRAQMQRDGSTLSAVDCMLAGVALEREETLLTRNIKHFSRIKGLKLESY